MNYSSDEQVWILSDLHLGHNKEFIWGPRGFHSVQEMNDIIIKNIQSKVKDNDVFYICGDLALGDTGRELLSQIPGKVHVILGNHDTDCRIEIYKSLGWNCSFAERIKYNKQSIFLSHYPTLTSNNSEKLFSQKVINISGHTHSNLKWNWTMPLVYNACCDANDCSPVLISDIIHFLKEKNN